MKAFQAILLIFFAVVLQLAFPRLLFLNVSPNFILIGIIYISLTSSQKISFGAAFLGGFLFDIFSFSFFGIHIIIFTVIAEIFLLAKSFLFAKTNFLIFLFAVFLGTFLSGALVILLNKLATFLGLQDLIFSFRDSLYLILKEFLYNLAVVSLVFIFGKVFKNLKKYLLNGLRTNF